MFSGNGYIGGGGGNFLPQTYKNTQGGFFPSLISARLMNKPLFVNAGTNSRLSVNDCWNMCKNAKCDSELQRRLPAMMCGLLPCYHCIGIDGLV